jgi:site-specific DNA recombinase
MTMRVAFYARVSSEQQAQTGTIDSQIDALQQRIKEDGHTLLNEYRFVDDGYSGSVLLRPELERLRDTAANYLLDQLYVHAPDRLARKYAYQYLLMEEFTRYGVDIIFLTNKRGHDPESELLLQVQGIISEYERTKIMERSRRGKLHAAKQGLPSVLSGAPYGYRYIAKRDNGAVLYEIIEEEAEVIRLLFSWIGQERMSINMATNQLTEMGFPTPVGIKKRWNRGSVCRMLKNPAYKGMAAFGKTKCIPKKHRLRPNKGQSIQSKTTCSIERTSKEQWIYIPVPPIIDPSLFDTVQDQLSENKRLKRQRKTGARYLLQGLMVCSLCGYGYCGNTATGYRKHNYYTCGGTRVYANRDRMCDNASIHADIIEELVWKEVTCLLNNPHYLEKEYHRRIKDLENKSSKTECNKLNSEKLALEKSIARLIDSYTDGFIEKTEFEPRIKSYKKRLLNIEQQLYQLTYNQTQQIELQILIGKIEEFSSRIKQRLEVVDWQVKRDIFEALIKQVEIGQDNVNVIFRVSPYLPSNPILEDCSRGRYAGISYEHKLNFH